MIKSFLTKVFLTCTMQEDSEVKKNKCYHGVLSKNDVGYVFEEAVKKVVPRRNPKLFDGMFLSLVHKGNGKYQCHFRTINASDVKDPLALSIAIQKELNEALKIIN